MFRFVILAMFAIMIVPSAQAQNSIQDLQKRQAEEYRRHMNERSSEQNSQNYNNPVGDPFGYVILEILKEQYRRQSNQRKNQRSNQKYVLGRLDITSLNVRRGPGLNYSAIEAIPKGANGIRIFGHKRVFDSDRSYRNWCLVQYRNVRGWSSCKYITAVTSR